MNFIFFKKTLALGSQFGKIYMWDLETDDPSDIKRQVVSHAKSKKLIRSIALSVYGREMIAVNDEGEIFIWKKNL
jgi:polycomb protein EED